MLRPPRTKLNHVVLRISDTTWQPHESAPLKAG